MTYEFSIFALPMERKVRVRFAPSPTGPLHLGGVRTALYNYLFAKHHRGYFILRIEDTDQARFVPGAEAYILESLAWAGITLDEGIREGGAFGPYRQSDRKQLYRQYADQLLKSGHAYIAFDTPEELEAMRQDNPNASYNSANRQLMKNSLSLSAAEVDNRLSAGAAHVIRLKVPQSEEIRFYDQIRGWVSFQSSQVDDKVLFKSDGMPTYHLANVVDDHLMQISHVIRGEEWLPSTPIHVLLYRYLGWEESMPEFAHLPLILKPDGNGKLSKRDGDRLGFPVFPLNWSNPETGELSQGFRERGFLPEAFMNMLVMLGWNPGVEQEIFSKEELIELFDLEKIHKSGAKFDFEKAKWFNAEYIKKLPDETMAALVYGEVEKRYGCADLGYITKAVGLVKDRLIFINDFNSGFTYLFIGPEDPDPNVLSKLNALKQVLNIGSLMKTIETAIPAGSSALEQGIKDFAAAHSIKTGDLMKFLRVSLVGELSGPHISDLILLLGAEEVVKRIQYSFGRL
jgi:glutamyl-tRNA synthetase